MGPPEVAVAAIMTRLPWTALMIQGSRVTWLSEQEAFGWPASSLMEGTLSLLWHPEDREQAQHLRERAQGGLAGTSILRVMTRQGEVRTVEVKMTAVGPVVRSGAMGSVRSVRTDTCLVTLQDITERVRAQERTAEAEAQVALFGDHAGDLLCSTDTDRRITWASASVRRLLGWEAVDLVGTFVDDLVHPEDRHVVQSQSERGGGESWRRLRMRDGGYRWMAHRAAAAAQGARIEAFMDVDGLMRAHEQVRLQCMRLQEILQALPVPHVLLDPIRGTAGEVIDFGIAEANQQALAFLSSAREAVIGASIGSVLDGPEGRLATRLRDAIAVDHMLAAEDWQVDRLGEPTRRIEVRTAAVAGALSLTWRDVTDERSGLDRLQASERHYRLLAENASDAVAWLRGDLIQWASSSVTSMLGWLPGEWTGRRLEDFVHLDDLGGFADLMALGSQCRTVTAGAPSGRFRIRSKDLDYRWVQAHARPFVDPDGQPDGVATSLRIVDAEVEAMRALDHLARTDELTGLMNRREALQRISDMGANSRRAGDGIAVLFCDVDGFKEVNDRLGHAVGDVLLRKLAHRIAACVRSGDFAARMGGDEILVVLDGVHGIADALDVAEKIRVAASVPMELPDGSDANTSIGQECLTMSIGVVHVRSAREVPEAIARADAAMYGAKRDGANRVLCL